MTSDRLSNRVLNRALLHRQSLLSRTDLAPAAMIEQLVGMQAQNPLDPYFGLWARLIEFQPESLANLIGDRKAVRTASLRATIHLVTSRDLLRLDATIRPVARRVFNSTAFARSVSGVDLDRLLTMGRDLIDEAPRTRAELAGLLGEQWPEVDAASLAQAVTYHLALVQVPPRGIWGDKGPAAWANVSTWIGREPGTSPRAKELVTRYLAAFGPATVGDIRVWSGVTGLSAVVDELRPGLRVFIDETGRQLLDVPDGELPDSETPAPARLLPEYDNCLLGHEDRSRIIGPGARPPGWAGNFLVDGFLAGSWKLSSKQGTATITVDPFRRLRARDRAEVESEAHLLLASSAPGLARDVVFRSPSP